MMREFMAEVGIPVGILLAIVIVVINILMYWFGVNACDAQWADFEHRFGYWSGCMVEYEGTWYPDDVVRTLLAP